MNVRRVENASGSHIEPPLDDSWDDLRKLCWHLAVTLHDAGLPQSGMVVRLLTGGTEPLDDFPMYQLGIPGYSVGPLSYTAMWDVINGVEFGVRAAREAM